jgi:hypothetical protein
VPAVGNDLDAVDDNGADVSGGSRKADLFR